MSFWPQILSFKEWNKILEQEYRFRNIGVRFSFSKPYRIGNKTHNTITVRQDPYPDHLKTSPIAVPFKTRKFRKPITKKLCQGGDIRLSGESHSPLAILCIRRYNNLHENKWNSVKKKDDRTPLHIQICFGVINCGTLMDTGTENGVRSLPNRMRIQ